jgi:hypothetical protein
MSMQRTSSGSRLAAIDQFRGFAIFLMVLADFLGDVERAPAWLKHAPDVGYTLIDLIAPMFIFAIGITFGISFRRRLARDGAWRAYEHFITRNLALIGLGALLTMGGNLTGIYKSTVPWGLLQAIGAAGLLTLPVIRLRAGWRWAIGLALLAFYQFMLDRFWLDQVSAAVHNGPWGALSWGALLIMATALADLTARLSLGRPVGHGRRPGAGVPGAGQQEPRLSQLHLAEFGAERTRILRFPSIDHAIGLPVPGAERLGHESADTLSASRGTHRRVHAAGGARAVH